MALCLSVSVTSQSSSEKAGRMKTFLARTLPSTYPTLHLQNKITSLWNFVPNSGLENFATACRPSQSVVNFVLQRRTLVYIRWRDVTESMVTTRSPFCGYNMAYYVELRGKDFIVLFQYDTICWFIQMSVWSLTCRQSVFKRYHSSQHFSELYPQDGGENQQA